jgi:hypothetical protein
MSKTNNLIHKNEASRHDSDSATEEAGSDGTEGQQEILSHIRQSG